jgi:LAGLIDADG DNA endonuclease family protein
VIAKKTLSYLSTKLNTTAIDSERRSAKEELRINFDYYKFKRMGPINERFWDLAPYLAGLLDGEGSFNLLERGKANLCFRPQIQIAMCHELTIDVVAKVFNVGPVKKKKGEGYHNDSFYIRVTTEKEVQQICETLLRYSITKLEQIKLLLRYFSLKTEKQNTGCSLTRQKEILIEMVDIFIGIKKLNERPSKKPPNYEEIKQDLFKRIK